MIHLFCKKLNYRTTIPMEINFKTHVHCRLCDNTNFHAHCNRCQRVLRNRFFSYNISCEYFDLGGKCDKCDTFMPNITTQTHHRFCTQCNICIDNFSQHIHCNICNVITNHRDQHYHCRWCSNLNKHVHVRHKHPDDTIQSCGIEGCNKNYNHTHCKDCAWINNPGPFQFHKHCSKCDRTDRHTHPRYHD